MKFKILVLSDTLERSRRLLSQFCNRDNIDYAEYCSSDPYLEALRFGKLKLKDGTLLVARSVSQNTDRLRALKFDQVFTDLSKRDIPAELLALIELELSRSEVPPEFQWQYLCPDYMLCYKCNCCKQNVPTV